MTTITWIAAAVFLVFLGGCILGRWSADKDLRWLRRKIRRLEDR